MSSNSSKDYAVHARYEFNLPIDIIESMLEILEIEIDKLSIHIEKRSKDFGNLVAQFSAKDVVEARAYSNTLLRLIRVIEDAYSI